MSLVGTYTCKPMGAVLTVTSANDANGQGTGTFSIGGNTVNVDIHYHFANSSGPSTNLAIWGMKDDPNFYVGGAGVTNNDTYKAIQLAGGASIGPEVIHFGGSFVRG